MAPGTGRISTQHAGKSLSRSVMFNEAMSASLQMPVALEMLGIAVGSMCGTLDAGLVW